MKIPGTHNYYVYIVTNKNKTVLYTGVTNDMSRRLYQHQEDASEHKKSFTARYDCCYLLYWERFDFIQNAIAREKEIKGWLRKKKEALINEQNPEWRFLNNEVD